MDFGAAGVNLAIVPPVVEMERKQGTELVTILHQVSISQTFNGQLFLIKLSCFYLLTVWLCNFLMKDYMCKNCS